MNCTVEACMSPARRRGYCGAHYARLLRHGDPLAGGPSPAAAGAALEWLTAHVGHAGRECLDWPFGKFATGYGTVRFEGKNWIASRLMCEMAHGPAPSPEHFAAHSCGRGGQGCTNPRHLRWALPIENSADAVAHGAIARGSRQGGAKLTAEDVKAIRAAAVHRSHKDIASEFDVTPEAIGLVVRRKNWAWVE